MKRFDFSHKDREHLIAEGLCCPVCGGQIHDRGLIQAPYGIQYQTFTCPGYGHTSVLRIDFLDGHLKIHFYALPEDVEFDWYHVPLDEADEPTISEPEAAPIPIVPQESEAKLRQRQVQIERTANALEAHRLIAELVLSKRRKDLSFVDRSTVLGRLNMLRGRKVWAVDANHPTVTQIIDDHGGKIIVGRIWDEMKLIVAADKQNGIGQSGRQRTHDVRLGGHGEVYCYLFLAKQFEDARKNQLAVGSLF